MKRQTLGRISLDFRFVICVLAAEHFYDISLYIIINLMFKYVNDMFFPEPTKRKKKEEK